MEAPELPVQAEMVELVPNGKHAAALSTTALPSLAGDRFDENQRSAEMEEFLPHGAEKKQTHFTDFEGKTSFGMSVFNLSNAIMGSGILGLAYAMANTGIVLFLFLLTAVALLSSYSIHLLLKSSGIVGIRAYEQLGYRAFGTPGKLAAAIAITLQNIGAMSSYLYIVKSEVPLVIQTFLNLEEKTADWYLNGNYLVILVSVTIILPLALMKQLGYLGYASGFSLSCMVFFLISVIYKKFHIPCPLPEQGGNGTGSLNYTAASGSGHWDGSAGLQPPEPGACTPSFFTLNSQPPPPRLADGLHHPHHGLRLRVPPRGAAHLHGAEGPLQEEDAVHLQHLHRRHVPHVLPGRPLWLPHVLRARGVGAAAHLQQGGPLRRADPLRAGGRADGRHAHRPHRPLPGAPGHPADAIPWQELQLDPPRRHRCGPADLHQPPGHFCPLHPWHLWHDRCHLCPLPHLHLPGHLLHPHHAQGQGAPALHPQNPGSLLRSPRGALHDHEPELHHHRLGHGGGQEWRQPLATLAAHPDPPQPCQDPPGAPTFASCPCPWLGGGARDMASIGDPSPCPHLPALRLSFPICETGRTALPYLTRGRRGRGPARLVGSLLSSAGTRALTAVSAGLVASPWQCPSHPPCPLLSPSPESQLPFAPRGTRHAVAGIAQLLSSPGDGWLLSAQVPRDCPCHFGKVTHTGGGCRWRL